MIIPYDAFAAAAGMFRWDDRGRWVPTFVVTQPIGSLDIFLGVCCDRGKAIRQICDTANGAHIKTRAPVLCVRCWAVLCLMLHLPVWHRRIGAVKWQAKGSKGRR